METHKENPFLRALESAKLIDRLHSAPFSSAELRGLEPGPTRVWTHPAIYSQAKKVQMLRMHPSMQNQPSQPAAPLFAARKEEGQGQVRMDGTFEVDAS